MMTFLLSFINSPRCHFADQGRLPQIPVVAMSKSGESPLPRVLLNRISRGLAGHAEKGIQVDWILTGNMSNN